MAPLIRRVLILWRAWRARKVFGPQVKSLRQSIDRARRHHRPVRHLQRRLRAELGVK